MCTDLEPLALCTKSGPSEVFWEPPAQKLLETGASWRESASGGGGRGGRAGAKACVRAEPGLSPENEGPGLGQAGGRGGRGRKASQPSGKLGC